MNSEKVKEIKEALETCMHTRVSSCRECPYNYTNTKTKHSECFRMAEHALTLINELEKENGGLKEHVTEVEKGIINIAKERNKKDELASKFIDSYNDSLKQFAEKLKAKYGKSCSEYYPMLIEMTSDDIDELLKECEK